jgi:hypothetical protein
MRPPKDIDSVFRIANDASKARAEEFLARPDRRRQVELAVFGPWHGAPAATTHNRNLAVLGAIAGLRQHFFEEALLAVLTPVRKEACP